MKTALITGVSGQDGSYLAELLLGKGYNVVGMTLPGGRENLDNIRHLLDRIRLVEADLGDPASIDAAVGASRPDELYNLAARSFVPDSWDDPALTGEITGLGVARLLGAVSRLSPGTRFFQASSAAIFGDPAQTPQSEATPIRPNNPYGAAKAYAHFLVGQFRRSGLYACSGILFNHESPRRGVQFVTRKVTRAAARIKLGLDRELKLGSLDARRDWGFAGDYVEAMWLMLQQKQPGDFVIATGRARTVRELVEAAFAAVGLPWEGVVAQDPDLVRPDEAVLVGDPAKARSELGWEPRLPFDEMIRRMVAADMESARAEAAAGAR